MTVEEKKLKTFKRATNNQKANDKAALKLNKEKAINNTNQDKLRHKILN